MALAAASAGNYLRRGGAAASRTSGESPFAQPVLPSRVGQGVRRTREHGAFFNGSLRRDGRARAAVAARPATEDEVVDNPEWRRIDKEWLYSAEQLALDMNDQTNNSSLVLAFELGKGGKVLLFAADAQRGNWLSWARKSWKDGDETDDRAGICWRAPCSTRSAITAATTRR